MSLLWPSFLCCVGLVPLIILAYICGTNRRHRYTVRMSSLSLVKEPARDQSQRRHHLPFSFFLIALVSLIVAMSRPMVKIQVPSKQGIIILALDVSRSMCSTDIQPTRLQALEATLSQFIATQSSDTKIGVVAFSDFAELIESPTEDKAAVDQAIMSLMTGWKRAIGEGIYESLDVITKEEGSSLSGNPVPAVIILVTNGTSNTGPSPLGAARLAAERGIRIYTVGLSSPSGPLDTSCQSSDPYGLGEESQHGSVETGGVDVATLEQIAALTGAKYFTASGISGLKNVFQDSHLHTILISENFEVTVAFAALGALFTIVSFLMALFWSPLF